VFVIHFTSSQQAKLTSSPNRQTASMTRQSTMRLAYRSDFWLEATTANLPDTHPKKAFSDWARDGLYGGWRKSEWAQPEARHKTLGSHHLNDFGDPYAFCLGDFEFQTRYKRKVPLHTLLTQPDQDILITRAEVTLRWQKNGQHNETRIWVRNTRNPVPAVRLAPCSVSSVASSLW
jgi:hypothetical protein